ncbi:MraY family glycosyltransferase [Algoriphagus halophytocola]|uniref:Undecaprenyl/decaprenyl-phosphate alpha-N-acetylglucosaminyl 1-phosphate transferase n=1 Tax=Algoriphagus halophytocola TaxID=2991499 RepID=A0ABY6MH00_9BACT|nr:MraY family glycosyltransferase [Algoriphagus sp. TR-M5]UZD23057.1 undecaprenyl/decaprenyl-phosphate alpha-N-acetylglucosaminyl 1-phosphate transferase [Algoriphagus sp. TR-M5]
MNQFLALVSAFGLGVLILPILIIILKKANIGDIPGGRKIHRKVTPSMGGIAIIFASLVSFGIWGWYMSPGTMRFVVLAISIMFFIGVRDDLSPLSALNKLFMQLGALLLIYYYADIRVTNFHGFLGLNELPEFASFLVTLFILFAITNAYNLIDGIDGLAGTIAFIPLLILGFWFDAVGFIGYSIFCFALLGAIIAFLTFNWHPAKIFMGDTGSLPVGFALAILVVAFMNINSSLAIHNEFRISPSFSFALALVLIPAFDMGRVFAKRVSSGKHPMKADKNHLHHLLMRFGMNMPKVVTILTLSQISILLGVVLMRNFSDALVVPIVCLLVLGSGVVLELVTPHFLKLKIMKGLPRLNDWSAPKSKPTVEPEEFKNWPINMN